jgi:uncharacterized RDD family membrane protein YckC
MYQISILVLNLTMNQLPQNTNIIDVKPTPRVFLSTDGVRTRRLFAFAVDFMMIIALFFCLFILSLIFAIPTFGFSFWALFSSLPWLMPCIALLYNGITVSGPYHATLGMRMFDIQITKLDGSTPDFFEAAAHAVLFYLPGIGIFFPVGFLTLIIYLPTFIEPQKRMLHDLVLGLIVSRKEALK